MTQKNDIIYIRRRNTKPKTYLKIELTTWSFVLQVLSWKWEKRDSIWHSSMTYTSVDETQKHKNKYILK